MSQGEIIMWLSVTRWNDWLGRHMFFVVLSALAAGFISSGYMPSSWPWNIIAVALFAYMTFITALEISFRDFFQVLTRPGIVLWVLILIHGVMPVVAWSIGHLFYPHSAYIRLGFLIGASIPIGVTSIIWTSVTKGDIALALVAVTMDTIVSPFLIPLFVALVAGEAIHVDYIKMMVGLLWMVTIPSISGMLLNDLTHGRLQGFCHSLGGFTAKAALFLVVLINAALVAPEIKWDLTLTRMLFALLVMVSLGYYLGYLGSVALKKPRRETVVAMVYSVGMRNISFGAVLAVTYFPPAVAIPVTLTMLYQQPLAAVASYFLNRKLQPQTSSTARSTAT